MKLNINFNIRTCLLSNELHSKSPCKDGYFSRPSQLLDFGSEGYFLLGSSSAKICYALRCRTLSAYPEQASRALYRKSV